MDLILPFLAALGLIGIKKTKDADDCLNIRQTRAVNGFFVVMIFIRHFFQYITPEKHDRLMKLVNNSAGQLIVVLFLFFSGYAFVRQYNRHERYLERIPKKIAALYLIFVITVLIFWAVGIICGRRYSAGTVLLAFAGVRSLGNSTWYVVAILFMWAFSYLSFRQSKVPALVLMTVLTAVYAVIMRVCMEEIYYNTVIAYLLGMLYASNDIRVHRYVTGSKPYVLLLTGACGVMILGAFLKRYFIVYEIWVIAFCLFLLLFSIRFQVDNKALQFLSRYSLEIYLIQRVPMILLKRTPAARYTLLYFMLCFIITLPLAFVMKKIYQLINKALSLTASDNKAAK